MTKEFGQDQTAKTPSSEVDEYRKAQEMELKQPGTYYVHFLSQYWNPEVQLFELPAEDVPAEGEYVEQIDLTEAYGRYEHTFKNNLNPREDFPEGSEGDIQFQEALKYQRAHNIHLAKYLKSQGWKPEFSWDINQEVCKEVFPEILDELFPQSDE